MNFSAISDRTFVGKAMRFPLQYWISEDGWLRIPQGPLRGKKWIAGFLATHGMEVHARCLELLSGLGYQLTALDEQPLEDTREILAVRAA